jgi:hypothetical protein
MAEALPNISMCHIAHRHESSVLFSTEVVNQSSCRMNSCSNVFGSTPDFNEDRLKRLVFDARRGTQC